MLTVTSGQGILTPKMSTCLIMLSWVVLSYLLFNYTWSCGYGLHYLVAIFAEFDMDSLLLFPPHLRRSFRLVINQSVGSSGVKSAPRDQSCLSADCFLRLSLLLVCYILSITNWYCPFICSYMWDLISRAHIWCAFGFVLETRCYKWYQSNADCRTQA